LSTSIPFWRCGETQREREREREEDVRGEKEEARKTVGGSSYPLVGNNVVKEGLVLAAADPLKTGRCFLCVSKDELLYKVNVLLTQAFGFKKRHEVVLLYEELKNCYGRVFVCKVVVTQDLGKKTAVEEMRKGAVTYVMTQPCEFNAQDVLVRDAELGLSLF